MIWTIPRTARKSHQCDSCRRLIWSGERYNDGAAAPGSDLGNTTWWRLAECSSCAERYGRPIPPAAQKAAAS